MQKILQIHTSNISWYIPEGELQAIKDRLKDFDNAISKQTAAVYKRGRRKLFASLGTTTNGEEIYLKVFRLTNLSLKLKHLFLKSKALRELITGLVAADRGVPVWAPLAAGEKRRMGLIEECYLLLKKIEGAVNLRDYFRQTTLPQHRRAKVIEALGRLARKSHEGGVFQTDFSLNNFLLADPTSPTPAVCIIDFERTYIHNHLSEDMRNWTLAKLNRVGSDFSTTDKLRFLRAYQEDNLIPKKSLALWMKELDRHTYLILRRDALRIHQAAIRGGRGYRLYEDGNQRVYSLEAHRPEELISITSSLDSKGTMEELGPFRLFRGCGKIHTKGGEMEVDIYRFLPNYSRPGSMRPAMEAWQTANALAKANIPAGQAAGAVESGEGMSYQGYLIVKHIGRVKGLRAAVGKSPPNSKERYKILWHTAYLLARLHNHGTLIAPMSEGDIWVQNLPGGGIRLHLARPFKFTMSLTMDGTDMKDRESDLGRLLEFLGDLLCEDERQLLRRIYQLRSSNIPTRRETRFSYTPGIWSRFRSL